MAKAEWGKKRTGPCGTKFYDFNKSPIICPGCGSELNTQKTDNTKNLKVKNKKPSKTIAEDDIIDNDEKDISVILDDDDIESGLDEEDINLPENKSEEDEQDVINDDDSIELIENDDDLEINIEDENEKGS